MRSGLSLGFFLGFGPGAALGIGRFAYALVLPAMQTTLGLSYAQAGVLGSANTAGYLVGALVSHRVLYAVGYRRGFYASLFLQAVSLALLAVSASFPLLSALRFVQGALGAFVFVGGAALLLASGGRGLATGVYFGGVGLGILLSPLIVPLAGDWGEAWVLLGALSLALTLVSLLVLRRLTEPAPRTVGAAGSLRPIKLLLVSYGLYGAGYIGYMTFVTTGLGTPIGPFWAVLGFGAVLTGLAWGAWVERVGGARGLVHILVVLAASSLYPLVVYAPLLSAFAFGISFLGVITAITQVIRHRLPPGAWARALAFSTATFGFGQALGPTLSGLAGDVAGGAAGALGLSTVLLTLSLAVAVGGLRLSKGQSAKP